MTKYRSRYPINILRKWYKTLYLDRDQFLCFFALSMDHKGEQINKQLKIDGGIIGISGNDNARDRFMLTAPILGEISQSFKNANGVTNDQQKHHQFTNAYTNRQNDMEIKLGQVLENYNLDFDKKKTEISLILQLIRFTRIIPKEISCRWKRLAILDERLSDNKDDNENVCAKGSLFEPMKRSNLELANSLSKAKILKVDQQLLEVKSHRVFFGRCALVAESNRNFDMTDVIGNHELDTVPRNLLTSDGVLHEGHTNKHQLVEHLTDNYTIHVAEPKQDIRLTPQFNGRKIIIVDAMIIVQGVANKKGQKRFNTCKEFADKFMSKVKQFITGYDKFGYFPTIMKTFHLKAVQDVEGVRKVTHVVL